MIFGHDDYGLPIKLSVAFQNPQGFYLWVSRNEIAVPILAIVPERDGTFTIAFMMVNERFRMSGVDPDSWVYRVDKIRWLLYTAS